MNRAFFLFKWKVEITKMASKESDFFYLEPPYFIQPPPSLRTGVVGSDILLDCIVQGDPTPRVRWVKNRIYLFHFFKLFVSRWSRNKGELDENRAKE